MALVKTSEFRTRAFAVALVLVTSCATCGSASAQYWGDRSGGWGWDNRPSRGWGWDNHPSGGWGDRFPGWGSDRYPSERYYRRSPYREPFSGERHKSQAPAVDYSKAPPPRKLDKPPSRTVVVIGDSMADWLAYGLDEKYAEQPEIGVERKIRATSGLVRYDTKNEALDWPQAAKDALLNEKPNAIVVMLGLNDRLPLHEKGPAPKREGEPTQGANQSANDPSPDKASAPPDAEARPQSVGQTASQKQVPAGSHDFHTDQWATLYAKRIDAMIAALKSKGVPVIWVGLPAIRGTKTTSDISYLDELYRERAERAGINYVDIWDGFVDDDGDFAMQGPDFEGQTRRLRTPDGVYFTKAGAVKLANYVDRELRRVMPNDVAPVAVPGPETKPKPGQAGARPDVGPVLPLMTGGNDRGAELLGAKDRPTQTADPIAEKVLNRGEPLAAPAGRADDFAWPRSRNDVSAKPEVSPEPVAVAPDTPEKLPAAGDGSKKQADTKKDVKEKSKIDPHTTERASPQHYYNYYTGRH